MTLDVTIPDIGDFADVEVIEIAVAVGDRIEADDPILMLESDKATLDIPSPAAGLVTDILVAVGDRVSEGSLVMRLDAVAKGTASADLPEPGTTGDDRPTDAKPDRAPVKAPPPSENHTQILVIGAGPGGYTAAFRAADLGKKVTLVDPRATLGGVCLNVGCIPSKTLLHLAKVRDEASASTAHGLIYGKPKIDLDKIRGFKDGVVAKLTGGLNALANRRKVEVIPGVATFDGSHSVAITTGDGTKSVSFDHAIIAVGSEPVALPFLPDDPRIMDSTGALDLADIPKRLLIIGGGIIGLEMAEVYHALGSKIDVVEMAGQIIPGADQDIVAPLAKRIAKRYATVRTDTRVTEVDAGKMLKATLEGSGGSETATYDRILVAVGRTPNGGKVAAEVAGIGLDGAGFIPVDAQMRTSVPHIFAIGDVIGQPMLAHKAVHEGKVAAEVAAGEKVAFEAKCIPSVAYTDPEVAWVGLTENEAKASGKTIKTASFPWMASGRALSLDRNEGLTKLLFDPDNGRVLGAGIVGPNAGDLIAEVALAIEMGADADDIGLTIHPHPTLSETVGLAAEMFSGTITDL